MMTGSLLTQSITSQLGRLCQRFHRTYCLVHNLHFTLHAVSAEVTEVKVKDIHLQVTQCV